MFGKVIRHTCKASIWFLSLQLHAIAVTTDVDICITRVTGATAASSGSVSEFTVKSSLIVKNVRHVCASVTIRGFAVTMFNQLLAKYVRLNSHSRKLSLASPVRTFMLISTFLRLCWCQPTPFHISTISFLHTTSALRYSILLYDTSRLR
jgi:hypothetical protein